MKSEIVARAEKNVGVFFPERRGGRVVEGNGLENRQVRKGLVGSNPTPSALEKSKQQSCPAVCAARSARSLTIAVRDTTRKNRQARKGLVARISPLPQI